MSLLLRPSRPLHLSAFPPESLRFFFLSVSGGKAIRNRVIFNLCSRSYPPPVRWVGVSFSCFAFPVASFRLLLTLSFSTPARLPAPLRGRRRNALDEATSTDRDDVSAYTHAHKSAYTSPHTHTYTHSHTHTRTNTHTYTFTSKAFLRPSSRLAVFLFLSFLPLVFSRVRGLY